MPNRPARKKPQPRKARPSAKRRGGKPAAKRQTGGTSLWRWFFGIGAVVATGMVLGLGLGNLSTEGTGGVVYETDRATPVPRPQDARPRQAEAPLAPARPRPSPEAIAAIEPARPPVPEPAPSPRAVLPDPLWLRHAVPTDPTDTRPKVAIVIDDLGLNRAATARTVGLPGPLTLAFLPYAQDLARQTAAARQAGHELIVHVPMEPAGRDTDPGPNALVVGLSAEEIARRMSLNLAAFEGYVGINNHMGSRFTADAAGMSAVIEVLAQSGLLFLDSRTSPQSIAADLAAVRQVPHAVRDVFLDHEATAAFVEAALIRLEALANRNGAAIAIGHPKPATLDGLAAWLPTLEARGLTLVPISAVVRPRNSAS